MYNGEGSQGVTEESQSTFTSCHLLHSSPEPTHLEEKNTHVLFLDFSLAFNTIIPQHLAGKLGLSDFSTSLCNWLSDSLTDHSECRTPPVSSPVVRALPRAVY